MGSSALLPELPTVSARSTATIRNLALIPEKLKTTANGFLTLETLTPLQSRFFLPLSTLKTTDHCQVLPVVQGSAISFCDRTQKWSSTRCLCET